MSSFPKNVQWVRSNREIARLLGIPLPKQRNRLRNKIAEIHGWTLEAGFPEKVKGKGWAAREVREWGERKAQQLKDEKLNAAAVAEVLGSDKPSRAAVKHLGNIEHRTPGGAHSNGEYPSVEGTVEDFRPVESIRQLAVRASRHFKLHIMEQRIKDWLAGKLPPGASPFPLRDPNRNGWNNPRPCFEWIERYYAKPKSASGGIAQEDLFSRTADEARLAEMQKTIDSAAIERLKKEALQRETDEKWILRETAMATASRVVADILHLIETEYERDAPARRRQWISGLLDKWIQEVLAQNQQSDNPTIQQSREALLAQFSEWDTAEERGRIDRIRAACAAKAEGRMQNAEVKA